MAKSIRVPALLLATFSALVVGARAAHAQTAYEAPPDRWFRNTYGLSATGEYFTSNSNYDQNRGSFTNLLTGNTFTSFESHLRGRYNWTPRFSTFAALGFTYVNANDKGNSKTATAPTDLSVAADYVLNRKYVSLVPEIQLGFPITKTDPQQTNPLTSDGVPFARLGAFAYRWFSHVRVGGYLGFHFPFQDLASRFMYEVTGEWHFAPEFTVGLGIDGYETAAGDSTSWLVRNATALRANAGSERYYAYNPALLEGRAWIGYRASNTFSLRLGYAKSLNGMDTAAGQSFLLYVAYNPVPSNPQQGFTSLPRSAAPPPPSSNSRRTAPRVRPDDAVEGFAPDIENSPSQEIFQREQDSTEGAGGTDPENYLEENTKQQQHP